MLTEKIIGIPLSLFSVSSPADQRETFLKKVPSQDKEVIMRREHLRRNDILAYLERSENRITWVGRDLMLKSMFQAPGHRERCLLRYQLLPVIQYLEYQQYQSG